MATAIVNNDNGLPQDILKKYNLPSVDMDIPEVQDALWLKLCAQEDLKRYPFNMIHALFHWIHNGDPTRRYYSSSETAVGIISSQDDHVIWRPSATSIEQSNILALVQHVIELGEISGAQPVMKKLHAWSVAHREAFWSYVLHTVGVNFHKSPVQIIGDSNNVIHPQWLCGAQLNIADSVFQHASTQPAIVWRSENMDYNNDISTYPLKTITFDDLHRLTNRVANGLIDMGFKKGDCIAIDMPMTAESVAIYLGIVSAGMVVVSIADSFSAPEIEKRLRISSSTAIFTVDWYIRGGKMIHMLPKVTDAVRGRLISRNKSSPLQKFPIIVIPSLSTSLPISYDSSLATADNGSNDSFPIVPWQQFLSDRDEFCSISCDPDDPTNILFSSGTTGDPKAIPWTHTTPIKAIADGFFHHDIHSGDVICWPTNIGWMMGPWLIYQLAHKATIALFNGSPTLPQFGQFVQDARVTMLGTIPTIVKSWMHSQCMEPYNWSSIRVFSSTGECSHPTETMYLLYLNSFRAPMIEYCGGTEIGGGYVTGSVIQDAILSAFSTPALGIDFILLDSSPNNNKKYIATNMIVNNTTSSPDHERSALRNSPHQNIQHPCQQGEAFIIPPSIGISETCLNRNHFEEYYENTPFISALSESSTNQNVITNAHGCLCSTIQLRRHGDEMKILPNGYYKALGRKDDTMNLGGIKVGSAELERCMLEHPLVAEVAAVGIQPQHVGQTQLVAFVVILENKQTAPLGPAPIDTGNHTTNPLKIYNQTNSTNENYGDVNKSLQQELQHLIRCRMNPLFHLHDVVILPSLPKTASNKVIRKQLRMQYYSNHTTI